MTLWEIMASFGVNIACPSCIGQLKIVNIDDFCRFSVRAYMVQESDRFQNDLCDCLGDYDEAITLGQEVYLYLSKESDASLTLKVGHISDDD